MGLKECDLVMKGGITSGIVYPPLILKLKNTYRFRYIGGTSAGAIAAAMTAAAEHGRESGGFDKLAEIQAQIAERNFLLNLFQPSTKTQPLMNFCISVMKVWQERTQLCRSGALWQVLKALLKSSSPLFLTVGLMGSVICVMLIAYLLDYTPEGWRVLAFTGIVLFTAFIGSAGAAIARLLFIIKDEIPKNFIGICSGHVCEATNCPVLTDWLHKSIQHLAGIGEQADPLTFGKLERYPSDDERGDPNAKEPNILLKMVTSNLSQNQPYVLPFKDHLFVFKRDDFEKLFPQPVVEYLVTKCNPLRSKYRLPTGYCFLPEPDDLPVIVATRLSLSFPILLSAIPLYTVKPMRLKEMKNGSGDVREQDLQVNWFSDGGICSNFPIHFFDTWLPKRPTFGINLSSVPDGAMVEDKISEDCLSPVSRHINRSKEEIIEIETDDVYLPKANGSSITEIIAMGPNPNLLKFLWSIFITAQNYRDNTLSVLPSYRERIVQIRLKDSEGGLNLTMPTSTIQKVIAKGEKAGAKLEKFDFEAHQWTRFRVLMKQMEAGLCEMEQTMSEFNIYKGLLSGEVNPGRYPYPSTDKDWLNEVIDRLQCIGKEIKNWKRSNLFAVEPTPLPEPVLRLMTEI